MFTHASHLFLPFFSSLHLSVLSLPSHLLTSLFSISLFLSRFFVQKELTTWRPSETKLPEKKEYVHLVLISCTERKRWRIKKNGDFFFKSQLTCTVVSTLSVSSALPQLFPFFSPFFFFPYNPALWRSWYGSAKFTRLLFYRLASGSSTLYLWL